MKHSTQISVLASVATCWFCLSTSGADIITLQSGKPSVPGEIGLHSQMALPVSSMYPEYTILRSTNLVNWDPVAGPIAGSVGVSDEFLRQAVPLAGNHAFYRVVAAVKLASPDTAVGDAIYGYGTEFGRQLQTVGQLPLSQFVSLYTPTNQYLPQITFDPTTAEFWTNFQTAGFSLNTNELAVFQTNGFVVSGRLGTYSFADSYYNIFSHELPVFFSCDAALHAWHRSYMSMLEEVEEVFLAKRLQLILNSLAGQVPALNSQAAGTALATGVQDADYFLAVGLSLITSTNNYGSLGQTNRVLATLTAITNLQPVEFNLFGANRWVDFSQFQVRGHYDTSQVLQRYFRAMMWCGQIDFRYTGHTNDNSLRELSGVVAMHLLLKNTPQFNNWKLMDDVVQMFVGVPDSLNFAQLSDLMTAAGIASPANLPNQAALQNLQSDLMSGYLGVQQIQSGYFFSPLTRQQIKLPRSFTVLGQRFVPDAWAMGQCVFDKIIWDADGLPGFEDKVMRRVPSALDIAFSVFGNNQTVPDLAYRIANTNGVAFRDGYPYQHNLVAARRVVDAQDPSVWTNNIYYYWLACLRELSTTTTGPEYPDALRTRAWGMKTLNTQLASWTELRHDTVLYVKQPYTGEITCSYPDGLIEPRVSFWDRMRNMALRTKDLMAALPRTGTFVFEPNPQYDWTSFTNSIGEIYTNRLTFLSGFATNMDMLRNISVKELNRQPLSSNEVFFVQSLIEDPHGYSGPFRQFNGWYPRLCYTNARAAHSWGYESSDVWDALVTDVHTDPPEPLVNDPGCNLHEGVGNIQLLMVAVNWGPGDTAVYAGPVMGHYEFQLGPTTRQTDSDWKSQVRAGNAPPTPDWTRGYWVPGTFPFPSWVY
jgi:hypothetical protein